MVYDELAALLDNSEEWFNVPPILRKLVRLMSEEAEASRKLIEVLRVEQGKTNTLIKRLTQRQANVEIDAAKNRLKKNIQPRDDEEHKIIEDVKCLKKKVTRNQEILQAVEEQIRLLPNEDSLPSRINACIAEAIETIDNRIDGIMAQLDAQEILINNTILKSNELAKSFNSLGQEHIQTDKRICEYGSVLLGLETKVSRLPKDSVRCQEAERNCSRLLEELSNYKAVSEKRFKSMFDYFEKINSFCENQRTVVDDFTQHCAIDVEEKISLLRGEMHKAMMDVHSFVTSATTQIGKDIRSLGDSVKSLKKRSSENFDSIEEIRTVMSATTKKVEQLGSVLSQLREQHMTFLGASEARNLEDDQLHVFVQGKNRLLDEIESFKKKILQFDIHVENVRAFYEENADKLRQGNMQLRESAHRASEGQLRINEQNERLCKLVGNISNALVNLEIVMSQRCTSSHRQERQERLLKKSDEEEKVLALYEHIRMALADTIKKVHREMDEQHEYMEVLGKQLGTAIFKICNLEKIFGTMAQKLECLQQSHFSCESWHEEIFKEVSPALIELKAIKRRIVFLEAKISNTSCDTSNDKTGMPARFPDKSAEKSNYCVLNLSHRTLLLEKSFSTLSSDAYCMKNRLQNLEIQTSRLGHGLTRALETSVESGKIIAHIQASANAYFGELNAKITSLDQKMNQSSSTIVPSFTPSLVNIKECLYECQQRIEKEIFAKQQILTVRVDELDKLVRKWNDTAANKDLQTCEGAILKKLDPECGSNFSFKGIVPENNEGYTSAFERIPQGVEGLWQALHTMHSIDLKASEGAAILRRRCDGPQCMLMEGLRCPMQDIAEIKKIVDACVNTILPNFIAKLSADLSENTKKQCELISRKHIKWAGNLERAVEAILSSLGQLREHFAAKNFDAMANASKYQGRLNTMEAVLANHPCERKQLTEDVHCLQETFQSTQIRPEEKTSKPSERSRVQSVDLTTDDFAHLEMKIWQLEEAVQCLLLTGLPIFQLSPLSIMVRGADSRKEDASLELLCHKINLLEKRMNATLYTKALPEQLELLRESLVNLLASKEDREAVDSKIDRLHQLITEEVSIQFRELRNDVMNIITEKVSLSELQDFLGRNVCELA